MRRWIPIAILIATAAGSLGHGDGGCCDSHDEDEDGAQFICDGDEDPAVAGTSVSGATYTLSIVDVRPPEPTVQGLDDVDGEPSLLNELTVTLTDGNGDPVEGATFTRIEPFAHKHDHGTPIVPEWSELGAGDYDLTSLNYIHRGPWRVDIELDSGGTTDALQFVFCIRDLDYEDAGPAE